jgi:hypothetical protein
MNKLSLRSTILKLLFWFLIIFILISSFKTFFNIYDEGFAVFNATRILNHETPYRDFWAIYPPGQLYILAGLFKLFGVSLTATRVYDTLIRLVLVIGVFLIARKMTRPSAGMETRPTRIYAYLVTLAIALVLASQGFYSYAVYPALAVSTYAIYSTLRFTESNSRRWLLLSGIISGIACIIRWDISLYIGIGLSAALFIRQCAQLLLDKSTIGKSIISGIKIALIPLVITLAIMLVGYGVVGFNSGFGYVWDQVFYFPATQLRAVRWLAYPELLHPHINAISDFWTLYARPMDWLRFYLPLLVYAIALIYYGYKIVIQRIALDLRDFGILAAALCGPLLFSQALSRYDFIHVMPSLVAASLVIAGLFPKILENTSRQAVKIGLYILTLAIVSVYFLAPFHAVLENLDNYPLGSCRSPLERASCIVTGDNQDKAVQYIQAHTQENEPIYVGNQRHDIIFVNFPGFYYLAARPSATRYSELHPGVANTLPVQQEIANELATKKVKYLVLVKVWESQEPNGSSKSTGVVFLDNYIHENYYEVVEIGEYQIWQRINR